MAKKEKVVKDTAERWLLTYADLMNLLLIFFIILYAMSQVDQVKYEELSQSLSVAFFEGHGIMPFSDKTIPIQKPLETPKSEEASQQQKKVDDAAAEAVETKVMEVFKEKVDKLIKTLGLDGIVTVQQQERGVQISIPSHVLFKPGSDEIESAALLDIERISKLLNTLPEHQIRVEGHTDSDPISTAKFASNWELSAARAVKVLRFLIEKNGIGDDRIAATGYADKWPIVKNDTDINKAKNRRVDIVILRNMYTKASPDKIDPTKDSNDVPVSGVTKTSNETNSPPMPQNPLNDVEKSNSAPKAPGH